MGMFSEIHAASEASSLDKILMVAIEDNNIEVLSFCKAHILPLYLSVCDEVFSDKPSVNYDIIIKFFEEL